MRRNWQADGHGPKWPLEDGPALRKISGMQDKRNEWHSEPMRMMLRPTAARVVREVTHEKPQEAVLPESALSYASEPKKMINLFFEIHRAALSAERSVDEA